MGFEFSNLNIFLFLFLLWGKVCFSQDCDSNGVKCISCTDYQACSGGVPDGATVSCKSGTACADDKLKECQMKLNCYALNECTEAGIFPDATIDSNFFVCLSDGATGFLKYEFSCNDDSFFDQSTQSCVSRSVTSPNPNSPSAESPTEQTDPPSTDPNSSPATDPTATGPTTTDPTATDPPSTDPNSSAATDPTATGPTTTDPTATDPPSTDPNSSAATDPTATDPPSTDPNSSAATDPTTTAPTTTPPTTPPPTACPMAGIFPLPDNCKMYYRCSTSLKPFYYICPGSSYFNEYILKCSLIITPTCQEQISKNSTSSTTTTTTTKLPKPTTTPTTTTTTTTSTTTTTTPKPTTTTTTTSTTTTTPKPTTTTASTTTTTTTTPKPSTCLTSGTYEDPSDCKTYYRCSTSGQIFRYSCPGNSYFNEFTKRCSVVVTPRCKNLLQVS